MAKKRVLGPRRMRAIGKLVVARARVEEAEQELRALLPQGELAIELDRLLGAGAAIRNAAEWARTANEDWKDDPVLPMPKSELWLLRTLLDALEGAPDKARTLFRIALHREPDDAPLNERYVTLVERLRTAYEAGLLPGECRRVREETS